MKRSALQLNRVNGFTVIELMMTIVVAAVIMTVGVPSFQGLMERNQLTSNINQFISTLALARSEAIKRNQRVVVCPSSNGTSCNNANGYETGWIIFVDSNSNNSREVANEELIWEVEDIPSNMTLRGSAPYDEAIPYVPSGRLGAINGNVRLCIDNQTNRARALTIISSGRVRLADHTTAGVPILSGSAMTDCT